MTQLEKLVTLLIAPHQPYLDTTIGKTEDDGCFYPDLVNVLWRKNNHSILLESCEHRILITASFFTGQDGYPERMFAYSHIRLTMLLNWMNQQFSVETLDALNSNLIFQQKFDTDPIITKNMYGGYVNGHILRNAERLLPDPLTSDPTVL